MPTVSAARRVGAALAEKSSELEQVTGERDALRGELADAREKLGRYESADTELSEKLAELERVKARVTDIELEAHERARVIEKNAAERAESVRRESEELLRDACRRYARVRRRSDRGRHRRRRPAARRNGGASPQSRRYRRKARRDRPRRARERGRRRVKRLAGRHK